METIKIPNKFRDRWFGLEFGNAVQAKFDLLNPEMEIDFSICVWIDPIPMLALLCHVRRWAKIVAGKTPSLVVNLGSGGVGIIKGHSPSRVRQYLVEHGFIKALIDACPFIQFKYESSIPDRPTEFTHQQVDELVDLVRQTKQCELYYDPVAACPPIAIDSDIASPDVSAFVNHIIQTLDSQLFRARSSEFAHRDSALVRLRQVAMEIVGNACEHAYTARDPGPVYIYARLRKHQDHAREQLERSDVETKNEAPLIYILHEVTGDRYVEFFACDIGCGLVAGAKAWYAVAPDPQTRKALAAVIDPTQKFPLRRLLSMVFRLPVSRHKRNESSAGVFRSNVTGLTHVNTVLSQHPDRSRVFVSPEWTAAAHPRPANYQGGASDGAFELSEPLDDIGPRGTHFHFAIDISTEDIELPEYWLTPGDADQEFVQLRKAFAPAQAIQEEMPPVFDLRHLQSEHPQRKSRSDEEIESDWEQFLAVPSQLSIVRMSRSFHKNLTDAIIARWVQCAISTANASVLTFCDMSQAQAILLVSHLEEIKFPLRSSVRKIPRALTLLVVAENLVSCVLELRRNASTKGGYFAIRPRPPTAKEVLPILTAVRHHDSYAFWRRVSSLCTRSTLLVRNVQWLAADVDRAGVRLPVYLDYSLAVQDRELAKILRRSLRRALAAFPELEAYGVDELVKPDFEDARRWARRSPVDKTVPKTLFVISSLVTGATIDRERRQRGNPAAVLGCFLVETIPTTPARENYFMALEWKPNLNAITDKDRNLWERVPGTPFIRPYAESIVDGTKKRFAIVRPIARILEDRVAGSHERPSAAQSYDEWHRDRLLRVGHWSVDRRHGLIEIDHTRALHISAESRTGFYDWLAAELKKRSKNVVRPLLVYPASRLNAIMIRHLFKMSGFSERPHAPDWQALPLNYLPDVGDGLRQLAPLTREQIRSCQRAGDSGVAFFIDIGFVGNRTFRHTKRQLLGLGLKAVTGLGMLNRTSFPALTDELSKDKEDVICYWRIDIPTLDDERSCPVCKGRDALKTLRERARTFQPGLVKCIDDIRKSWALSDPSLTWWDRGLEPIEFRTRKPKNFGFTPPARPETISAPLEPSGQSSLVTETGDVVPASSAALDSWSASEVTWSKIWLQSSTQAAAYAIEIARTQASQTYPWRFARQIAEMVTNTSSTGLLLNTVGSGAAVAVEVIACHMLLCASDLDVASREEGGALLLHYMMQLETERINESDKVMAEQYRRLRGLAALAFANLDSSTKQLLLDKVVEEISLTRIQSPETCVALMAIIENEFQAEEGDVGPFEKLVIDRQKLLKKTPNGSDTLLSWNYRQVTLSERPLPEQFKSTLEFFGAGEDHGACIKVLEMAASARLTNRDRADKQTALPDPYAGWALLRSAMKIAHSLICRGWQSQTSEESSGLSAGTLFSAICQIDPKLVSDLLDMSNNEFPVDRSAAAEEARDLINAVRVAFQRAIVRFEPPSSGVGGIKLLMNEIEALIESDKAAADGASNIRLILVPGGGSTPQGMRYVLFGHELKLFLKKLKNEAMRYSPPETLCTAPSHFGATESETAQVWVGIRQDPEGSVVLEFWNRGNSDARKEDFKRVTPEMIPVHDALGTGIKRITPEDEQGIWFSTQLKFKWISGGAK